MSTINIAFFILAVVGVFYITRIALRQTPQQEPPEKIRLRKLRVQLWVCVICMVLYLVAIGVMYARGVAWPPAFSILVLAVITAVLTRMIFRVRKYKNSIKSHDA